MTELSRRLFLRQLATSGSILAATPLLTVCSSGASSRRAAAEVAADYGPLAAPGASGANEILLELPEGFSYRVFGREGSPLSDGAPTPGLFGGLALIALRKNQLRLVRNHGSVRPAESSVGDMMHAYDPIGGGSSTAIHIDPATGAPGRQFMLVSGTANNAGGGPTPWSSWITCEATTRGASSGYTQPHGYCFDMRVDVDRAGIPVPLKSMGRFVHASACVDPDSGSAYLTEHGTAGAGFYRFLPRRPKAYVAGGKLQMLAVAQQPKYDARTPQQLRQPLPVAWVDIADPDPANAEDNPAAVFEQGASRGGMTFPRLGGVAYDDGAIYFTASRGGEDHSEDQLWEYRIRASRRRQPSAHERVGTLQLVSQSRHASAVRVAPELCVSPRGSLLLVERGAGNSTLRVVTRGGLSFPFARVVARDGVSPRFGGAAFSPDGGTLYVNQQSPGLTLAIQGPWERGGL